MDGGLTGDWFIGGTNKAETKGSVELQPQPAPITYIIRASLQWQRMKENTPLYFVDTRSQRNYKSLFMATKWGISANKHHERCACRTEVLSFELNKISSCWKKRFKIVKSFGFSSWTRHLFDKTNWNACRHLAKSQNKFFGGVGKNLWKLSRNPTRSPRAFALWCALSHLFCGYTRNFEFRIIKICNLMCSPTFQQKNGGLFDAPPPLTWKKERDIWPQRPRYFAAPIAMH